MGYTIPPLNTEKNPLVFFGKMLAKKEGELGACEEEEKVLEVLFMLKFRKNWVKLESR